VDTIEEIRGGWNKVPDILKTKTQLNQMGLKPIEEPKAEVWSARVWILLYDVSETKAKRQPSQKQLQALEKARQKREENLTCDVCGDVQPHERYIFHYETEKICEGCDEAREEKLQIEKMRK
jgi:DNA polymerase III subunit epsilon